MNTEDTPFSEIKMWHDRSALEAFSFFHASEQGLSSVDVEHRFDKYGRNELPESNPESIFLLFVRQFKSPLIFVLLFADVSVLFLGDIADAIVITTVLLFNACIGAFQERRSRNAFAALRKLLQSHANVIRDGMEMVIADSEVVPGDVLALREGMRVAADARVFDADSLRVDESSLTGESNPIFKTADPVPSESVLSDQKSMVFKGTTLVSGSGRAVVVATGRETNIGKMGEAISSIVSEFPMKDDLRVLSQSILVATGGIALFLSLFGLLTGMTVKEIFSLAVALAVSVIPEGLPVILTLVLALGVWRMSRKQVLVKNLQAIEAMGQMNVLALDKTGTITKNELTVREVLAGGKHFEVTGSGYIAEGSFLFDGKPVDPPEMEEILFAAKSAAFSSSAHLAFSEAENRWMVVGDPTEAALLVFANKAGFTRDNLDEAYPKVNEKSFDYALKYRSSVREFHGGRRLFVSGAPEVILQYSQREWMPNGKKTIEKTDRHRLEGAFLSISQKGLRVIAIAMASIGKDGRVPENMPDLDFIAFIGMRDSLREGVAESVATVQSAGIRPVMITGDHRETAEALAAEAGVFHAGDTVLTGEDLDQSKDEELFEACRRVKMFARVTPEHKLRIITLLRKGGNVVAMTGDGVNDALSLSAADVGISMGGIGTEVAKEASDIVLLDDNFRNVVAGAEEGRNIFATMRRVMLYLFSASIGEALTILGAIFIGLPIPILATQILWLNLVTDGFLDMALAFEPKRKGDVEEGESFDNGKSIQRALIDRQLVFRMVFLALPMAIGTLLLFAWYLRETDLATAWTVSLVSLSVFQWLNAWNVRSFRRSFFAVNPISNPFLLGATALVVVLQVAAVYAPFLQSLLHTVPLSVFDWVLIITVACSTILVEELRKLFVFLVKKRG